MTQFAHSSYLETQVLTATPQKLRLMLIEAAIRFGHQTIDAWAQNENDTATDALIRCRDIIGELLSAVRPEEGELTRSVADIYLFLFQALTTAHQERDEHQVQEVLSVLEVERETWKKVCEQMPAAPAAPPTAPKEITSSDQAAIAPTDFTSGGASNTGSVSFDA